VTGGEGTGYIYISVPEGRVVNGTASSNTAMMSIFVYNQLDVQLYFLYFFIRILYMVRATKCSSSSGESIVSIRHLVYAGVHPNLHTTRPRSESDIYQRSYWYNCLFWGYALGCSKHV